MAGIEVSNEDVIRLAEQTIGQAVIRERLMAAHIQEREDYISSLLNRISELVSERDGA